MNKGWRHSISIKVDLGACVSYGDLMNKGWRLGRDRGHQPGRLALVMET